MLVVALQGASRLSQCAAEDTAAAFQAQGVMPKCCQNVAAAAAAPPTGDTIQLDGGTPCIVAVQCPTSRTLQNHLAK